MTADTTLLSRAGWMTKSDGLETARQKLTLLVLADWEASLRSVDLFDLATQTIQTHGELMVTLKRLATKGYLAFAGFGYDAHDAPVMVDAALHLPEVSE